MSDIKHTIVVEFDQALHPSVEASSLSEPEKLVFAALDTAYKLLAEYAVRATLAGLREALAEQGQQLPSDEELFKGAHESGVPGAPHSYADLAPQSKEAAFILNMAFDALVDVATQEASEGFGIALEERA